MEVNTSRAHSPASVLEPSLEDIEGRIMPKASKNKETNKKDKEEITIASS